MNRGIYALASGMIASQQSMDVITNNLANVNTAGFKSDQMLFNEELERQLTTADKGVIGSMGTGPAYKGQFTNFKQGSVNTTNNPTEFALEGSGMFGVQTASGQTSYTRNGSFAQDSEGNLTTKDGAAVLDPGGEPIRFDPVQFSVSSSGTITNSLTGQTIGQIGIFNGTFTKTASGSYSSLDATAQSTTGGSTKIQQGALESSNVSSIESMVQMISLGRNFDMAQKSMLAEDDMTQKLNSILS